MLSVYIQREVGEEQPLSLMLYELAVTGQSGLIHDWMNHLTF